MFVVLRHYADAWIDCSVLRIYVVKVIEAIWLLATALAYWYGDLLACHEFMLCCGRKCLLNRIQPFRTHLKRMIPLTKAIFKSIQFLQYFSLKISKLAIIMHFVRLLKIVTVENFLLLQLAQFHLLSLKLCLLHHCLTTRRHEYWLAQIHSRFDVVTCLRFLRVRICGDRSGRFLHLWVYANDYFWHRADLSVLWKYSAMRLANIGRGRLAVNLLGKVYLIIFIDSIVVWRALGLVAAFDYREFTQARHVWRFA